MFIFALINQWMFGYWHLLQNLFLYLEKGFENRSSNTGLYQFYQRCQISLKEWYVCKILNIYITGICRLFSKSQVCFRTNAPVIDAAVDALQQDSVVGIFGCRSLDSNFWTTEGRWRSRKLQCSKFREPSPSSCTTAGTGSHSLSRLKGIDPKTRSYQSY